MPRCVVTGSYSGHLAVACIDSTIPVSSLSSRFTDDHSDLSLTIKSSSGVVVECTCSAPMRLPSVGGVYISRMRISVGPLAKFDLVIGEDWITATRAIITSDGLAEPSMRDLRHLSSDHTWEPFASGIGQLQKAITPPQVLLRTESILGLNPRTIYPRRKGKEPGRKPVEVPFDITHYIVSLLESASEPHSFAVDVATMTRLCLVSRTFNAAANAVLYSSITISETAAWFLAATVEVNPALLHHCHSLCFKVPAKPWLFKTWVTVAQIVYACPNLRRVAWLPAASTTSSMWSGHLPQITDLIFPHISPIWLSFGPTYCFPRLKRLIIGNALLEDDHIVHVFLRMPQLTDLVTDPPSSSLTVDETRVEALAQGIAAVVAGTALRRIIWAQIYSVTDPEKTPQRSKFEKYIPICARAHDLLRAPDGRHGVTFEFVPWSLTTIRSRICDGTIWKRGDEDRPRICP